MRALQEENMPLYAHWFAIELYNAHRHALEQMGQVGLE